ncbi:serine/threonine-protein kinase [Nonomuraea roseoviolacea]|uniref:Serine/threonine protein kinase n=1 Tax=Nonomuraea roseoviolacea subsp. carminata TaxID=160689 RepID=A0ABT1JXM4_9ACTN|nr:serine/threonine-protein kinase [Nonomuraea roseoviolacea]MCP2346475.1 serine/threonine protein kinase [Nonomuraea roseoviolacea subsp. carminata]
MPSLRPLRSTDPREIAGYVLHGRLGEGGQGTVFFGTSPAGVKVAVKLLHDGFGSGSDLRRFFERELAALQRVAPFCTARVLAADPGADPPYVVSEYVEGPSVLQAVRERGVLKGADLDRLAIATATALGAIHAAGVVHRDFKPANVLLAADGPRVIDFGIARPLDASSATVSGAVGTPAYMAPEQLSGDPAGPPMDMFAWGCTIAFAANGRPPFGHEQLPAVIYRIMHAEPELGALGGRLREYVAACLAKDPARRPSAQQVLLGLMEDRPGGANSPYLMTPPPSRPPITPYPHHASTPPPPRKDTTRPGQARARAVVRSAVVVGAAAALVAGAVLLTTNLGRGPGPTPTPTPTPSAPVTPAAAGQLSRTPRLGLEVWQDGAASPLSLSDLDKPVTTVAMKRSPFELRFPTLKKDEALQVCAWTDDSVFSISDGGKVADHPCFRPGTGIADYEYGSGRLYLDNEGHNYLIGTRVSHQSGTQDKVYVSRFFRDKVDTAVADQRQDVYLTVFRDLDGDGTFKRAGEGEYEYVILHFPT